MKFAGSERNKKYSTFNKIFFALRVQKLIFIYSFLFLNVSDSLYTGKKYNSESLRIVVMFVRFFRVKSYLIKVNFINIPSFSSKRGNVTENFRLRLNAGATSNQAIL